jgi:hypothetical protein
MDAAIPERAPDEPAPTASLRGTVAGLVAGRDAVSDECQRLFKQVEARCPGYLPPSPLDPGSIGPEIPLNPDELQKLVMVAVPKAAGLPPGSAAKSVVWTLAGNELLVLLARVTVRLVGDGIALVRIPVHCDQVEDAAVTVPIAVGDDKRPAGLLAATEDRPRGPAAVVDVWGEALTAFAWQVLLAVATGVAAGAGTDVDGSPLIPAGLTASANGVRVLTMARHPFDRTPS